MLTQSEQEERLGHFVETVLDNVSLTWRLVNVLITYKANNWPPPQATVFLRGQGLPVDIPGTNCGFFVSPVVVMAGLDCRRSLEFFGLKFDANLNQLTPVRNRRRDDLGIEHFGLPLITRQQFIQATGSVLNRPAEPVLVQVHLW